MVEDKLKSAMKTTIKIITGITLVLGLVSCKRTYECECRWFKGEEEKVVTHSLGTLIKKDEIFYCDKIRDKGVNAQIDELT